MPGFPGPTRAFMSSSLQLAPGLPKDVRPRNGHPLNSSQVWYDTMSITDQLSYLLILIFMYQVQRSVC